MRMSRKKYSQFTLYLKLHDALWIRYLIVIMNHECVGGSRQAIAVANWTEY